MPGRARPRCCAMSGLSRVIQLLANLAAAVLVVWILLVLFDADRANDAVHDEPASAAYVENFALRVFAGADNEDRNGNITKYVCMCML